MEQFSQTFGSIGLEFDMNAQALDHMFVSRQLSRRRPRVEHIHVNTWARLADQVNEHDPTVALVDVCS